MAKARSPGYPSIGLGEAIEKITLVWKKDYQNRIPRAVVADHMGYNSLNGKSLGVLSAVAKFGLLEGRGEENRVSDLALQIIAHERGSAERMEAIREAATSPELFSQIEARFPNGVSEAALRSYLLTQKFIPQAAEIAARSYRETMQLVSAETDEYPSLDMAKDSEDGVRADRSQDTDSLRTFAGTATPIQRSEGEKEYLRYKLSPNCEVRLLVRGEISHGELRKLRHLVYLSEAWSADEGSRPPKADEVEKTLDEASKP